MGDYWLAGLQVAARDHGLPELAVRTLATDGSDAARVVTGWVERLPDRVRAQRPQGRRFDPARLHLSITSVPGIVACKEHTEYGEADFGDRECRPDIHFDPYDVELEYSRRWFAMKLADATRSGDVPLVAVALVAAMHSDTIGRSAARQGYSRGGQTRIRSGRLAVSRMVRMVASEMTAAMIR